jgi:two-component system, OmpR family, response regulator ChvI
MSTTPAISVVLVDDDRLFRDAIAAGLRREGFEVLAFDGGAPALAALAGQTPRQTCDVIVLDWRMPEMEGPQVLERLRAGGVTTPVVMLTSLSDQVYEEAALGYGAVDFVDKERSVTILAHRLRVAASRSGDTPQNTVAEAEGMARIGDLALDLVARRARWQDREIDLTLTEFDMVAMMAQRAGRDVTYRELYDLVHGSGFQSGAGSDGYRSNVRGFIKRIRRKFETIDPGFTAIENYPGFGYRWRPPGTS